MTGAPLPLAVISADQQIGFTFQLLICFGNTYYFMCKRTDRIIAFCQDQLQLQL